MSDFYVNLIFLGLGILACIGLFIRWWVTHPGWLWRREVKEEFHSRGAKIEELSNELSGTKAENESLRTERDALLAEKNRHTENLTQVLKSNLISIPWLAGMMGDFLTYDIEVEAMKLDWGSNKQRAHKVASIREIRANAAQRIEEAKVAVYQLEYLRQLFPALDDVLESDYTNLELAKEIPAYDPVRRYLEKEEWLKLSESDRNQLALDRYVASRSKSSWQIGRDYELSVAYEYLRKGYQVDTFGSYMGLSDLGRDLIAKRRDKYLIIQCKYWSRDKTIHEKHIYQLFGTLVSYCIEQQLPQSSVDGIFVTNITLSPTAKKAAAYLGLHIVENHEIKEFPRIKCNLGKDEYGTTRIYHLPMDDQYDAVKISKPGEFYAFTVKEAESQGFRRAYKWRPEA